MARPEYQGLIPGLVCVVLTVFVPAMAAIAAMATDDFDYCVEN